MRVYSAVPFRERIGPNVKRAVRPVARTGSSANVVTATDGFVFVGGEIKSTQDKAEATRADGVGISAIVSTRSRFLK